MIRRSRIRNGRRQRIEVEPLGVRTIIIDDHIVVGSNVTRSLGNTGVVGEAFGIGKSPLRH